MGRTKDGCVVVVQKGKGSSLGGGVGENVAQSRRTKTWKKKKVGSVGRDSKGRAQSTQSTPPRQRSQSFVGKERAYGEGKKRDCTASQKKGSVADTRKSQKRTDRPKMFVTKKKVKVGPTEAGTKKTRLKGKDWPREEGGGGSHWVSQRKKHLGGRGKQRAKPTKNVGKTSESSPCRPARGTKGKKVDKKKLVAKGSNGHRSNDRWSKK